MMLQCRGYQIIADDVAAGIAIGDLVSVGTAHTTAPIADPRPAISSANYGAGLKLVSSEFFRATRIGPAYKMVVDHVADDEDHSYDGQRIMSQRSILVRRVYFSK